MMFEDWYKEKIGSDTCRNFSYDELKDAWEEARQIGYKGSMRKGFYASDIQDLIGQVSVLSLKDQKQLAESILYRLYEKGWEVQWDDAELLVTKTEEL